MNNPTPTSEQEIIQEAVDRMTKIGGGVNLSRQWVNRIIKDAINASLASEQEKVAECVDLLKTAIRCARGLGSEWRQRAKVATQDWTDHNPLKLPTSYRKQAEDAALAKIGKGK